MNNLTPRLYGTHKVYHDLAVHPRDVAQFVEGLLGKPWQVGAKGPDMYDCWGLVQHVQRNLAGRDLIDAFDPPTGVRQLIRYIADHPAFKQWQLIGRWPAESESEAGKPAHLGPVVLAHVSYPTHVGTYLDLDGGVLLHSQLSTGVTIDTLVALQNSGWRRMLYYDWIG